jgi:hypothetical protein
MNDTQLTEQELSRLRFNKLAAEIKMTKAELAVDKAISDLLAARKVYHEAYAQVIKHNAERVTK